MYESNDIDITGVTGSGKTTTLTHILSEYSNNS